MNKGITIDHSEHILSDPIEETIKHTGRGYNDINSLHEIIHAALDKRATHFRIYREKSDCGNNKFYHIFEIVREKSEIEVLTERIKHLKENVAELEILLKIKKDTEQEVL